MSIAIGSWGLWLDFRDTIVLGVRPEVWQLGGFLLFTTVIIAIIVGYHKQNQQLMGKVDALVGKTQVERTATKDIYKSERVFVAELAYSSEIVENKTFDHCEIIGPAIVGFGKTTIMTNCSADVPKEQFCIPIVEDIARPQGLILFANCIFSNCSFRRINMLVAPSQKKTVDEGITNAPM